MDADLLHLLVHPIYKTPLLYDEQLNELADAEHHDRFALRQNVPVLLTKEEDTALTHTEQHGNAGSSFHYKEHYQQDAETYDYFGAAESPAEKEEHNRLHQYILSQIHANASWVLDVGCGGGWLADTLKNKNKKVISMDISDINPVKAVRNVPYPTHYGLVADVFELPIKEGTIDCIVASEIIEHVSDPKRFLDSLYAAVKPGGRIIVTTPYNEHIQQSLCIHCNRLTPHNAHLHSFTEQSIQRFLPDNTNNFSTTVFNNKILVRTGLQRLMGWLPLAPYKLADAFVNALSEKRAYRLILIINK